MQQRRIERGALLAPQGLAHLEGVIEKTTAPIELEPGGLVLFALPSDADAEIDPSVRQDVERRQRLGQHDRAAQRGDQNVRAEANTRRDAGNDRQHGERLEPETVGTGGLLAADGAADFGSGVLLQPLTEHHVVGYDETIETCGLGGARTIEHVLPAAGIFCAVRREIERELWEPVAGAIGRHGCEPSGGVPCQWRRGRPCGDAFARGNAR